MVDRVVAILLVMLGFCFACDGVAGQSCAVDWQRQLGTSSDDLCYSVAVDGVGNSFICGLTEGVLGQSSAGGADAYFVKNDPVGSVLWSRQLGTSASDTAYSVAVDASGNAFISGWTEGSLGGTNAGGWDAFLTKYDSTGSLLWSRQLGTSSYDTSYSVAVDVSGNAYISGSTYGQLGTSHAGDYDAYLAKYDPNGNRLWVEQLGTSEYDVSWSVAADTSGNVYISGRTDGGLDGANAGQWDAFLAKYDSTGSLLWSRQLGTSSSDTSYSVTVDSSGNAFTSGWTRGALGGVNAGGYDAFLAKYDSAGNLLWVRQLGTSAHDKGLAVGVDDAGNAFISGQTAGSLGGANAGHNDAYLAKYDPCGVHLWTQQIGSSADDYARSVAVDSLGGAYIGGYTAGDFAGTNAGFNDAFLVRFAIGGMGPTCGYNLLGDIDGNCKVDLVDVGIMGKNWLTDCSGDPYALPGDLDENHKVDLADFAIMAGNWLVDCVANPTDPACVAVP